MTGIIETTSQLPASGRIFAAHEIHESGLRTSRADTTLE